MDIQVRKKFHKIKYLQNASQSSVIPSSARDGFAVAVCVLR